MSGTDSTTSGGGMLFGLFDKSPEEKLEEARLQQEQLIAAQLRDMKLEHELENQTMMQKGLIAQQQLEADRKKEEERLAAEKAKEEEAKAAAAAEAEVNAAKAAATNGGRKAPPQQARPAQPGPFARIGQHIQMARKGYEQLVHAIIRPPRASYKTAHLGPADFSFLGKRFHRYDVELLTERGLKIHGSHWIQAPQPSSEAESKDDDNEKAEEPATVVVYMHGNASARVEVHQQLSYLLSLGTSVFSFDFAGSGWSDGEYVSLGYYEREDLATVVAHLRSQMGSSVRIALWGRSMGAATALMYASREATLPIQNVACLICDSSYCDLPQLASEMVDKAREQGIAVPNVVVSVALAAIGSSVQNKASFDIRDISPYRHGPRIDIPALFVCGEQDDFIKPHHSERIAEHYRGQKNLLLVQGDHNDLRPPIMFMAATQFLSKHLLEQDGTKAKLGKPAPGALEVPEGLNLRNAPWQHRRNPNIYTQHAIVLSHADSNVSTASSAASLNVNTEMGFTQEKQDAIQSSLATMLGKEQEGNDGEVKKNPAGSPKAQGEEIVLEDQN